MADYTGVVGRPLTIGPWPLFEADAITPWAGQSDHIDWALFRDGELLDKRGGAPGTAVTVVEMGGSSAGRYLAFFTPTTPGNYVLEARHVPSTAHLQAQIRVDTVDLSALAGFSVVPLDRGNAVVGEIVELRVRFVLPDGTPFEPYELRQVQIADAATDQVLFSIGAANIDPVAAGTYRVFTPIAPGQPVTLRDRWFFRGFHGPEVTRAFTRVVAEPVGADDLLISIERLRRHELGGVDQRDNDGRPYPDETYREAIREATDQVAAHLDITVRPTLFEERHDYRLDQYRMFGWFELDHRPVAEILKVRMQFQGSGYMLDFPPQWVNIGSPNWGQFNLVPQTGTLEQFLTMNAGTDPGALLPVLRPGIHSFWPHLFSIEYRAGFDVGKAPPRLQKAIALLAAIEILNIAGEQIIGSGIASTSISIGGLSQSVGTTSSATNAGHGALILQYERQLYGEKGQPGLLEQIRRQFHGVSIGCA